MVARNCQEVTSILDSEQVSEQVSTRVSSLLKREIPEAVDYIQKSADDVSNLLDGLKRFAEVGRIELNITVLDMDELISQIAGKLKVQIQESGAQVSLDPLPRCLGDASQIGQVFENLLTNAIKYLDANRKGSIRIWGKSEKGTSTYCVEDNGVGIAPENQEKVFEIFHRIDCDGNVSGEGLGLSIVQRILERYNGTIRLESEVAKGSKFFVSLPSSP